MKRLIGLSLALAVVTAVASLSGAPARAAQPGPQVGILSCETLPGTRVDHLVYSNVDVRCVFRTPVGVEHYRGRTGIGLGLDLSWKRREDMNFAVLAASSDVRPGAHALAGNYGGAKASVTAGLGLGTAALVGGGNKSVALHPIGLEGSRGFGLSAGLSYLVLEPAAAQ